VPSVRASNHPNEYFIAGGLLENVADFWGIQKVRDQGYPVTYTLQFRGHSHAPEEYDFMGHWLLETWDTPNSARPAPASFGDTAVLTEAVMTKLTTFWHRFQQEPDSIKTTARRAHIREVRLSAGTYKVSTLMVDMPALAAQYPSVAADLTAAGLTPKEHEVYRIALASARAYRNGLNTYESVHGTGTTTADSVQHFLGLDRTSPLVRNAAFLAAHPDAAAALEATGMWETP
jgi:hypothetical protein